MLAISRLARWVKAPARDVAVVVVSSPALAKTISDELAVAISDWDQVAHLCVEDMDGLQADWLAAGGTGHCVDTATVLLRSIPKRCYLLDLETGGQVRLAWLGSVCGHELRCLQLAPELSTPALNALDATASQVREIVDGIRALVKQVLEERFVAP